MDDIQKLKTAIDDLQNRLREEIQLRTELERRCHLLEKLAYRDPSSGLRTETYLHARVREEIERSIRYPAATTLVTLCVPDDAADALPRLGMHLTDELRSTDQVFSLNRRGLAILLVETPEEGARHLLERLGSDLKQFVKRYGCTVTSFPVDANLAEDFMNLAIERHKGMTEKMHADGSAGQVSQSMH
ncbi:MAG: GGDEF domain-containing protein [Candidatus Hydrogenedentes bacterium]|nr:GGDEF domain-containing protein [Candidatus Hydrogenedentota bacterium]